MRNRFDYASKGIGLAVLSALGRAYANDPINPETQYADLRHEPDSARDAERAQFGLLGRLAAFVCLIETYSQAPSAEEFRACLLKHLASWQQRSRKGRAGNHRRAGRGQSPEPFVDSFLWIVAAGAPTNLLAKLRFEPASGWPPGVYFGDDILRVGIIVASELPRDSTTVLIRLMAGGPLLAQAIKEIAALPPDAVERAIAEPILIQLQAVLGQKPNRTPEEQEFIVAMQRSWEDARAEGRVEGRVEGGAKTGADFVLTVLRSRGIVVPDAARDRILGQTDVDQLKRWLEKALSASSIDEVLDV